MVVIALSTVLVAIAVPRFSRQTQLSTFRSTYASYLAVEKAAALYCADWAALPGDASTGLQPPGFGPYMRPGFWSTAPAIGGAWDWNNTWGTANAASYWTVDGPNVSVAHTPAPTARWTAFDQAVDNGVLTSGFLKRSNSNFLIMKVAP